MLDMVDVTPEQQTRRKRKLMDYEVPTKPPTHPGIILLRTIMPQKGIDAATLASRSGLSPLEVDRLLTGKLDITAKVGKKLAVVLGQGADLLRDQQKAYTYFGRHGKWPPPTGPIPG